MDPDLTLFPHYASILAGTANASYLTSARTPVEFHDAMTTDDLWDLHTQANITNTASTAANPPSLLDLKRTIADRLYTSCVLCERRCHVDRRTTPGACKTLEAHVACEFLHYGEERVLVPSHTVFFSGCTLHCAFCQNWDISQSTSGDIITPTELARRITQRATQGARNVNWVGGDPTANLPYILTVLHHLTTNIPQVWNSNMYCSQETMQLLSGVIDLYLTDFKFGNDVCASRLAGIDNYLAVVQRNHLLAAENGDVLVRHLILPNHVDCCSKPILDWLADHLPQAAVNIMAQYHPEYHAAAHPELRGSISTTEYKTVAGYAESLGLHLL